MSTETAHITPETANHVLAMFGSGGYPPGTFGQKLLELLAYADEANLAQLALGFPAEVAAVRLAQYDPKGIDTLRQIAGSPGICCRQCLGSDGPFEQQADGWLCEGCVTPKASQ